MLGGVCGGLGERVGVDPTLIRIFVIPLALLAGGGVVLYIAAWILLPRSGDASIARRVLDDRRELRNIVALSTIVLCALFVLQALGLHGLGTIAWPLLLGVLGLFVVWRGAPTDERTHLQRVLEKVPVLGVAAPDDKRNLAARGVLGVVLVGLGLGGVASFSHGSGGASRGFFGAIALAAGFLVIFGPWWLRLLRDLSEERRERVRAEERADLAGHVHDSVLQTLALIQRAAGDPSEVERLARRQERELRSWLFEGLRPGSFDGPMTTLQMAIRAIEAEVEDTYAVSVECVIVGDCALDDSLKALLGASREAIVNAAKWSGERHISVYVEAAPGAVSIFVRDRGRGFNPDEVSRDRSGIAHSIVDRLNKTGGSAVIRSAPGAGCEVELQLPRIAASR